MHPDIVEPEWGAPVLGGQPPLHSSLTRMAGATGSLASSDALANDPACNRLDSVETDMILYLHPG